MRRNVDRVLQTPNRCQGVMRPFRAGARWRRWHLCAGLAAASVVSGCSGDTSGAAAVVAPSSLCAAVQLNYHAVNLALAAPYDTVTLVATALDAAGQPNSRTATSTSKVKEADSTVTVDSSGRVQARYTTLGVNSPTYVVATLTVLGVTHEDTAFIQVVPGTPVPAPLATFSLRLLAGDSAKVAVDYVSNYYDGYGSSGVKQVIIVATNRAGVILRDDTTNHLLVNFTSDRVSDGIGRQESVDPFAINVGHTYVHASTYAYGVVAQDSLRFSVGYPIDPYDNTIGWIGDTTATGTWTVDAFTPDSLLVGIGAGIPVGEFWQCGSTPVGHGHAGH